MPTHERLDLNQWIQRFTLANLRADTEAFVQRRRGERPALYPTEASVQEHINIMSPHGEIVVGPYSIAVNEQLRSEKTALRPYQGRRLPVDLVVWGKGDGVALGQTKVGGVPFRSASEPWPRGEDNQPLRFVAQLCFSDSTDVVPRLPADVLLIFGDDEALLSEPARLVFEWVSLNIPNPLTAIPCTAESLSSHYGVLHRSEDWLDAALSLFTDHERASRLAIFEGTKFGGVPAPIQGEISVEGKYFASVGSISAATDAPHPFVNVVEPLGESTENDLMIGDMGSLHLFLMSDGQVQAVSECY